MNPNTTIRRLAAKQADIDIRALPKAATRRIKSANEAEAIFHFTEYYKHFCFHNKTYYEPCSKCRRTNADAKRNLSSL